MIDAIIEGYEKQFLEEVKSNKQDSTNITISDERIVAYALCKLVKAVESLNNEMCYANERLTNIEQAIYSLRSNK